MHPLFVAAEEFFRDDYLASDRFVRHFWGGGVGAVIDGFYPLLRYQWTDFGPVAYGRVAALVGFWDDHWDGFGQDSFTIIDEFAWGLEWRHRFGIHRDKTLFVDVKRELQNWGDPSLPFVSGLDIQGTAINLGVSW